MATNRLVLVLGTFLIALTLSEATCPGLCRANVPSQSICIVQTDPAQCLKIKECALNELNCARRRQNVPPLGRSNMRRCALIGGPTGSGRCFTAQGRCQRIDCRRDKVVRCQRAGKSCRLLTNCEAKRENCRRPRNAQLKTVGKLMCKGLKRSSGFRPCRKGKKKKKKFKLF